jgi:hypothetical protein
MTTRQKLSTKAQAVRAFRDLLGRCEMSGPDYLNLLRTLAEIAENLATHELVAQRIYALQAMKRASTTTRNIQIAR